MTGSTLAQLRQQITNEHDATQHGFTGLASVASHRAITARMERAAQHLRVLREAGREQEAQALFFSDTFYQQDEEA